LWLGESDGRPLLRGTGPRRNITWMWVYISTRRGGPSLRGNTTPSFGPVSRESEIVGAGGGCFPPEAQKGGDRNLGGEEGKKGVHPGPQGSIENQNRDNVICCLWETGSKKNLEGKLTGGGPAKKAFLREVLQKKSLTGGILSWGKRGVELGGPQGFPNARNPSLRRFHRRRPEGRGTISGKYQKQQRMIKKKVLPGEKFRRG